MGQKPDDCMQEIGKGNQDKRRYYNFVKEKEVEDVLSIYLVSL